MGLSAARQLAAKGANVIIIARSQQKLEAALTQIKVSNDGDRSVLHTGTDTLTS